MLAPPATELPLPGPPPAHRDMAQCSPMGSAHPGPHHLWGCSKWPGSSSLYLSAMAGSETEPQVAVEGAGEEGCLCVEGHRWQKWGLTDSVPPNAGQWWGGEAAMAFLQL